MQCTPPHHHACKKTSDLLCLVPPWAFVGLLEGFVRAGAVGKEAGGGWSPASVALMLGRQVERPVPAVERGPQVDAVEGEVRERDGRADHRGLCRPCFTLAHHARATTSPLRAPKRAPCAQTTPVSTPFTSFEPPLNADYDPKPPQKSTFNTLSPQHHPPPNPPQTPPAHFTPPNPTLPRTIHHAHTYPAVTAFS